MIISLVKEQNIFFFLLKQLWGPWVAKHGLTTDFVWVFIDHYFIINYYGKSRDTTARRM